MRSSEPGRVLVAVDQLWRSSPTGVGVYAERLVGALLDAGLSVEVAGCGADVGDDRYAEAHVRSIARGRAGRIRVALGLNRRLIAPPDGVVHRTNIAAPLATIGPAIATFHDLGPMALPGDYRRDVRVRFRRSVTSFAQSGSIALSVSLATATELVARFPDMHDRVVVAPLGPSGLREVRREPSTLKDLGLLPGRYVLVVGNFAARKRHEDVVDAFALSGLPAEWRLVIAGTTGPSLPLVREHVDTHELHDRVRILVAPGLSVLASLYEGAGCFALASTYEGFGLPVLDAMEFGLPVVVANAGSLPEVIGDAGLVVDSGDVSGLAGTLQQVVADEDLANKLSATARQRAELYSWSAHADGVVAAYRRALDA
jgi:glycosyltransferase involved in cell wall biosynthesis